MGRLRILIVVTLSGLVAAATATAGRTLTVRAGDTLVVSGTKVVCTVSHNSTLVFVSCGVVEASGAAVKGTYVAAIASNGRVVIVHAIAPGNTKTVFDRTPAAVTAKVSLSPGDSLAVAGTTIGCSVTAVRSQPTIFCNDTDGKGSIRPGSYAFGLGDTVITSLHWDAQRHVKLVSSWPENG